MERGTVGSLVKTLEYVIILLHSINTGDKAKKQTLPSTHSKIKIIPDLCMS